MSARQTDGEKFNDDDLFLRCITPGRADPTYSLLKAHLLFEDVLHEYIKSSLPHPESLEDARLTFAQWLAIAKACSTHLDPTDWRWKAIGLLNKLRNLLAHNLEPEKFLEHEQKYIDLILSNTGHTLPPPAAIIRNNDTVAHSQPFYLAVDLVTGVLFTSTTIMLGLVPSDLVQRAEAQEKELTKEAPVGKGDSAL